MVNKQDTISVIIAGDLCMINLIELMDAEYSRLVLRKIQPILDSADIRLINLENAIIKNGTPINKSGGAHLKANPENLVFLKQGNFDCAVLANNHVADYGEEGIYSTINSLEEAGIGYVGAGKNLKDSYSPKYFKANGCNLAVIAVCENEFGVAELNKAGTAGFNMHEMLYTIKEAKGHADFVIVIMHGGNEYNPIPSPGVVSRYRTFVDLGADAVIGMHPHCIQGFEYYNNAPIVYSTGNFLFSRFGKLNDPKNSWYYGYMPFITFEKGKPALMKIIPYRFDEACTLITPFTGKEEETMLSYISKLSEPLKDEEMLKKYFMGWCIISGIRHAKLIAYKPEYFDEEEYPTKHPLLYIRALFTCETQYEMLAAFFKMLVDGDKHIGNSMVDKILKLQKMPI